MLASAESVDEIQDAVRSASRIVPVAGRSKPALWGSAEPGLLTLDLSGLSGLTDYDPAELTFTARAATPIGEVTAALAEHGQYLPCDPPLGRAGATLGGVVAAGTSGAGAFRHGGVRDFVIGVALVDGRGRLVSGGGRVVKNAAGFDLPKLMVGSMGRLGIIVALSFKVFPRPRATTTLVFAFPGPEPALDAVRGLARGPLAADALDLTGEHELLVRLGGAPEVLEARAARCGALVGRVPERLEGAADQQLWDAAAQFTWRAPDSEIVRVALTVAEAPLLLDTLKAIAVPVRLSLGANLAWVAWPRTRPIVELDRRLTKLGLRGTRLDGDPGAGPLLLGESRAGAFAVRIRQALDPDHRFLEF
jgi:glycolate oxidase FAD binding subunit